MRFRDLFTRTVREPFDVGVNLKLFFLKFIVIVNDTGMDLDIELDVLETHMLDQKTNVSAGFNISVSSISGNVSQSNERVQPVRKERTTHVKMYASTKAPHQRIPLIANPSHVSVYAISPTGQRVELAKYFPVYRGHKLVFNLDDYKRACRSV